MGLKLAIGGKGGVGKTTVCAVWARLFADEGCDVLAIDADPNTNLGSAFGLPASQNPPPLIEFKELIQERTGIEKGSIGAYFKLNPDVQDLPEKYWLEVPGSQNSKAVKLLVLGGITQAGTGCACPEGAFLKALLTHTILHRNEVVLVDLAAGVEFMGRASIQGIDALVVVAEPGSRSIETANNIADMGRQLGVKYIAAVANKITDESLLEHIKGRLKIPVIAAVSYDPAVQQADWSCRPVFDVCPQLVRQLRAGKEILQKQISI